MKSKIQILIVILFSFISVISAYNQTVDNLRIKSFSMREGLSNSNVQCISQDQYGFIWFGTSNGLNKFDGYEIINYYHSEESYNILPSSDIRSLYKDSKGHLWVGTTKGLCKYNPIEDNFKTYLVEDSASLGMFDIINILEDNEGLLWLAAYREGIIKFDPENELIKRFSHNPADPGSLSSNIIFSIFQDSRLNIWVTTYDKGVNLFDSNTNSFTHFMHNPQNPNSLLGNNIHTMTEDSEGTLWFACNYAGISSIKLNELDTKTFSNYQHQSGANSIISNNVRIVCSNPDGGIWAGCENGLVDYLFDGGFQHYEFTESKFSIPGENGVNVMYIDNSGNLWVGYSYSGVKFAHPTSGAFTTYQSDIKNKHSLSHNKIWEFAEDKEGFIWIATDGGGLNRFDPGNESFIAYTKQNSKLPTNDILSVFVDSENDIWLGTWGGGISKFDGESGDFLTYTMENSDLSNNNVFDITEDLTGNLWIATQNGLNKLNKKTAGIETYTPENSGLLFHQVEVVKTDVYGNILIGNVQGFLIFDPKTKESEKYQIRLGSKNSLSDNFVTSIFEQDSNTIWISTNYGLNKLDRKTGEISQYLMKDGLPSNIVYGIEKDKQGFLWLSTDRGLVRFDDTNGTYENFGIDDGLQDYIFNKKSHLMSKDGKLYFGGINGFNVINPEKIYSGSSEITMIFTELLISNKPVSPNDETGILSKPIFLTDSITLTHEHPNFTLKFAAFDYVNAENIQYTYKLEGYDEEWNFVGKQRMATYTNLDAGKYLLKVKSHSQSEISDKNTIQLYIKVLPPWWNTLAFKVLLIIIISGLVLFLLRIRVKQFEKQKLELEAEVKSRTNELRLSNKELLKKQNDLTEAYSLLEDNQHEIITQKEEIENHRNHLESLVLERTSELEKAKLKAEESEQLKSAFLANLSHEIRTPMNAIVGFSSLLDNHDLSEKEKHKFISLVNSNCDSLTILINDIIDISLIESNQIKIVKTPFHTDVIFEELLMYYESINHKELKIIYENKDSEHELILENDPMRFKQIISNLLSNAFKYTEKGEIRFGYKIEGKEVRFHIADTGIGIKDSNFKAIFDHFHKIDNSNNKLYRGVGIGLSICKNLVQMMGGKIWLESEPDLGSTFFLTLPLKHQAKKLKPVSKSDIDDFPDLSDYSLLIAEDDQTNYMLIEKLMRVTNADIIWAKNGIEATEAVKKIINPEKLIVLMDIKMPLMNGIEALRIIRLKHKKLPIIAVTAYAQESDKLEILKNNFDGYVTKPISRVLLFNAIRKCIG